MDLKIKDIREEKGITQQDIADKLCITQPAYSQYENGKRNIPLSILVQIANILDCSIDKLIGRKWE